MNFTLESTIMTKHVKNRDIGRIVQVPFLCKHLLVYINHILNIANYGFVILFDIYSIYNKIFEICETTEMRR